MNSPAERDLVRIPIIPGPPHDPTWFLLNHRTGWRDMGWENNVEATPVAQNLALTPVPGSGRSLSEASGSFGGLTLPGNVAMAPDSGIYLLDTEAWVLKSFDPCECRFVTVPCIGDRSDGVRQFNMPLAIGIRADNLFVCDTGNHRLSVFSLRGLVLRAAWSPPASAELANAWEPSSVTFDRYGRVFVGDRANGGIHRFTPFGLWETFYAGFDNVTHIAIDRRDRLYALVEDDAVDVRVLDLETGEPLKDIPRLEALKAHFPEPPFKIDAKGNLHLGGFCAAGHRGDKCATTPTPQAVFNLKGDPQDPDQEKASIRYETKGYFLSEPLDSRIYRCQWHRVVLCGKIPSEARVRVLTHTSETLQPEKRIRCLEKQAWKTDQRAYGLENGEWDCLVRSGAGRYLWLKLEFRGDGLKTPVIESIRVEFPRISLRRFLPAVFSAEPESADFTDRFLSIFDTMLRSIETKIDNQAAYFDPLSTPAERGMDNRVDFLSWLASWIGVNLDRHWPETKRRLYLKNAAKLHHIRGTRYGLWQKLLFFLGMEPDRIPCSADRPGRCCGKPITRPAEKARISAWQPLPLILEHFQLRRWMFLGKGRLGDHAELWGARIVNRSQLGENARADSTQLITTQDPFHDPFHVYAHKFSVFVPASFGRCDRHKKGLENLLKEESPGHTQYQIVYVEPRFRIGFQSMIGYDSVIGMYPEGVVLDGKAPLGQDSVLGRRPYDHDGPSLQIGRRARVGTTTKLT